MNEQKMQAFQGKFVNLQLRFTDGRTRALVGVRVLSVGSGGFVVEDAWPTSVKHGEVISCVESTH